MSIRKMSAAVLLGLAMTVGSLVATPAPAHAGDSYGTVTKLVFGGHPLLGPWQGIRFNKSKSNSLRRNVVGMGAFAAAVYICSKVPNVLLAAGCIALMAAKGGQVKNALNRAHELPVTCFQIQLWHTTAGKIAGDVAVSRGCFYDIPPFKSARWHLDRTGL